MGVIETLVPRFIAFFGPDGTGKSTHANLLLNQFKANEAKVRKVWIRSPHTLAYLLSRLLMKIGFSRKVTNPYGRETTIPAVHKSRWLRFLWPWVELAGVLPVILFRVYIPLHLGYTLVAERYVVDTIVTIAYFTNDLSFLQSRTAKILLRFIPENTIFIHLDSNYAALMKRRNRTVEPYSVIEFQKAGYKMIGNSLGAKCIDTSNLSIHQVSSQIMDWLRAYQLFGARIDQSVWIHNKPTTS